MPQPPPRLLLLGCGHAHLLVLEALARGEIQGVRAALVTPAEDYYYSGMIPGVIAGCYAPDEARFDARRLAEAAGADFIRARARRVDPERRVVHTDDDRAVGYDLLSIGIGSVAAGIEEVPGAAEHAVPVKPMNSALEIARRADILIRERSTGRPARIGIVGGGSAGFEIACCLDGRLRQAIPGRRRHRIHLLERGQTLMPSYADRVRRRAARILARREIPVHLGAAVASVSPDAAQLSSGTSVPHDLLVWAAGPGPPPLPARSGLRTDGDGYLLVDPTLRAPARGVFGAGDCVGIEGYPWIPRAGVYAVREGPVLVENLRRTLRSEAPTEYTPQRRWLSLLNTGDRRALGNYLGFALHGRLLWHLKDRIDRRFMRRFQRLC